MRDYAKVSPQFWTGETGRQIRALGPDALVVALYLMTCPSANMIGLYYLPLPTLAHETGLTLEGASKALRSLGELGFAHYDWPSEVVFLPEGARIQIGDSCSPKDNRHKGILNLLNQHSKCPFVLNFYERYQRAFALPTPSPSKAPPKPLRSQEQEQEQKQEQEQGGVARSRANPDHPTPRAPMPEVVSTIRSLDPSKPIPLPDDWDPGASLLDGTQAAGQHPIHLERFRAFFGRSAIVKTPTQWRQHYRKWAVDDSVRSRGQPPTQSRNPNAQRQPDPPGFDFAQYTTPTPAKSAGGSG